MIAIVGPLSLGSDFGHGIDQNSLRRRRSYRVYFFEWIARVRWDHSKRCGRGIPERNLEGKSAAAAGLAVDGQAASEQLDNARADGESQAGSAVAACDGFIRLPEWFKN